MGLLAGAFGSPPALLALENSIRKVCRKASIDETLTSQLVVAFRDALGHDIGSSAATDTVATPRTCSIATQTPRSSARRAASPRRNGPSTPRGPDISVQRLANRLAWQLAFPSRPNSREGKRVRAPKDFLSGKM